MAHAVQPSVLCLYHMVTSSVIHYGRDAQQNRIFFFYVVRGKTICILMLGSRQRQLVVHRLNLPISWCATVSSMTLMVKLESWGYSHKSRIAWASCFWLTRTPVICVFHFHAPPFTWWEYVTMKCNYVKTTN